MPGTRSARGAFRNLALLPGAALALLPSAHCPLCLGAYGALAASLGVGALVTERVVAPLIAAFLAVGIATVAWSARSHRNQGPLAVTVLASAAVAAGRLLWNVPALVYVGGAFLIGASLWNLWLKRPRPEPLRGRERIPGPSPAVEPGPDVRRDDRWIPTEVSSGWRNEADGPGSATGRREGVRSRPPSSFSKGETQ
ncbi:MAG: MerC domain-containing protein [Deltaproteobacteria bacterium]